MKFEALHYLRCPVSNEKLQLVVTQKNEDLHLPQGEIEAGYLYCKAGMHYPIINGIPRMLPESMLVHEIYLLQLVPDFKNV